jgi:uncharacterized Ntn-hydrolase superfamily protein
MLKLFFSVSLLLGPLLSVSQATYSIVACDAPSRQCGVAVQTNNLAVGASVPYAQAGVGALASQFETNPHYGPQGMTLLSQGKGPDEVLQQLLRDDGNFDGNGIEARQVGIVSLDGRAAFYTGQAAAASAWAGGRCGKGYSIQGNGLAGPQVVAAMEQAFLATTGTLADRLLAALAAGDVTGGQKTGRESAALLVRTPDGFPLDIDLRVDHSDNPVAELQKLYDIQSARQQVIAAEIAARRGQRENARTLMIAAVARAQWPRVLIRAAKLAEQLEERPLALQYIEMAFSRNPAWAQQEIGSGDYAELGAAPAFHRWITADQEQRAIAASRETSGNKTSSLEDCLSAARILLEAGHPGEARDLLDQTAARFPQTSALRLTRAEAYAATGDYGKALKECQEAQAQDPNNWRIRLRIGRLREQMTTPESNK